MLILGRWNLRITPIRMGLIGLVALAIMLAVYRLIVGLGATTNLNDQWPWGLWIGIDLTAIALAGAGYSMCLMAHVLHIGQLQSVSRRAMLISLLGYVFVLATLILEIGRWDNAFRPLVSWGHASPLFEVFVAINFYMVIQALEFGEVVTETVFKPMHRFIKSVLPVALVLGAIIPFGHQASLGGLYLAMKGKLSDFWWSPALPWFYLLTSFYAGPAMVILEEWWANKFLARNIDLKVLQKLARISASLMAVYLIWKTVDLARLGVLKSAFAGGFEANMLLLEMGAGVLLPVIIGLGPWVKKKPGLLLFSLLSVAGIALSRANVVFTGMYRALGPGYTPSWIEWGITIGLVALVALLYLFIIENFNIYKDHTSHDAKARAGGADALVA